MTIQDLVYDYLKKGWRVIPVYYGDKRPIPAGWLSLVVTPDNLLQHFPWGEARNVGLILGEASGGMVDIDLDCPEAVRLATHFLPFTPCVFGRTGKPKSHHLYRVAPGTCGSTEQFRFPDDSVIVEYRANGGQTVLPGSLHMSGEVIAWEVDVDHPSLVDAGALREAVRKLADACRAARGLPPMVNGTMKATTAPVVPRGPANPSPEAIRKCADYLASLRPSISGQNGHGALFHACCGVAEFGLNPDSEVALDVINQFNSRCQPPWRERDLMRKLQEAFRRVDKQGNFGLRMRLDYSPISGEGNLPPEWSAAMYAEDPQASAILEALAKLCYRKDEAGNLSDAAISHANLSDIVRREHPTIKASRRTVETLLNRMIDQDGTVVQWVRGYRLPGQKGRTNVYRLPGAPGSISPSRPAPRPKLWSQKSSTPYRDPYSGAQQMAAGSMDAPRLGTAHQFASYSTGESRRQLPGRGQNYAG